MKRFALLLLLAGCDTSSTCADSCHRGGLRMSSWKDSTCTCLTPPSCQLETRTADVTISRAEVAEVLLVDCSAALRSCQARGGR